MKRSVLWLLCLLMMVPAGLAEDVVSMDDIVVEDSLLPDLTDSVQIEDLSLVQESELSSNAPGDGQAHPDQPGGGEGQTPPGDGGQPGGSTDEQSGSDSAATTLTGDSSGKTYKSTTGGENAVLVNGSKVKMTKSTVKKTGDSSNESADFYGTNAAILAKGGATLTIKNSKITSNGSHTNGVFSYGSGTTVKISNSTITTKGNGSGDIMTTGGATMKATNLKVTTSGNSSAPIRSDRGGGTVTITGGTYKAWIAERNTTGTENR